MAITLQRPVNASQIESKLTALAGAANVLMGQVVQAKAWCDDVLTDDHMAANLLVDETGQPLSAERLALYRAAFAALDALRAGANAPGANGAPSVGKLIRPYIP